MMSLVTLLLVVTPLTLYLPRTSGNCDERIPKHDCLFTKTLPTKKGYCYLTNCRHGNFMASIGNGFLATVIFSDTINVAGVYNGKAYVKKGHGWPVDYTKHTHRARIPSSCAINFHVKSRGEHTYALDTKDGVFYHWFTNSKIKITQKIYAHRVRRNLIINDLRIDKTHNEEITVTLTSNVGNKSQDIDFNELLKPQYHKHGMEHRVFIGRTREAETANGPRVEVAVVHTKFPNKIVIPANNDTASFVFITSISSSLEVGDALTNALDHWKKGWELGEYSLYRSHKKAWNKLWSMGNIIVGGNLDLAQSVSSSIYNILSSTRVGWPYGLSPGGLPGGEEYLGHVFWDQDIWMYPVLVSLFSPLAKESLNYRYNRIDAARGIAKKFGYRGAMFPWESALTGVEVSPGEVYGRNQIHITSDIAYAVRQYWRSTGDKDWIKKKGFDLVYETAKFWASRVSYDSDRQAYVINDVMPPDEHTYPANNSVYTNVGAKLNLDFAIKLGELLGRYTPEKWEEIRDEMFIPFNEKENYHPEHDGFQKSDIVKQADTILIGYPLMYDVESTARENDLNLYGNITTPNGPAMTHSMFTIGWLEIGKHKKAEEAFVKNFNNIHGPFKIWSEIRFGKGATNFITGAGGFLQSLINGYGGVRLRDDGLYFKGILPENCKFLTLKGIKYAGNSILLNITENAITVSLIKKYVNAKKVKLYSDGKVYPLEQDISEVLPSKKGVIKVVQKSTSSASTSSCFLFFILYLNLALCMLFCF